VTARAPPTTPSLLRRAVLALALAVSTALFATPPALAADGGADAGPEPPSTGAGAADSEQEIVDHLDELQYLELLQNLELFEPKEDGK
jgi:Spy/CpxP family protein refolding chaperone